uniref:Uncharacterized protein n=1 Tax=Kalanchoe fedtschenkoi TaxID=63787 RepID=A0A7N0U024_KALFE
MGMVQELISTVTVLVTKPFSLFRMACVFGLNIFFIIAQTWMDVVRATIRLHLNMFWSAIAWGMALVTLPIRLLNVLQRERQLEIRLSDLLFELENLFWAKKELEGRLKTAIKERRMVDLMLNELEDEHDKAIDKIEELEKELQELKAENKRKAREEGQGESLGIPFGIPAWKTDGSSITLQDLLKHVDATKRRLSETEHKIGNDALALQPPPANNPAAKTLLMERRREALQRSLFSAALSLLVGVIIWEAEDPCMPLVAALFTVVGMSLMSVVQFFSTIENKPASDAVALLSFNWFILGTLTYPTLPLLARQTTVLKLRKLERINKSNPRYVNVAIADVNKVMEPSTYEEAHNIK